MLYSFLGVFSQKHLKGITLTANIVQGELDNKVELDRE